MTEATRVDRFSEFYDRWHDPLRRALALSIGDVGLADEAIDEAMTRALTSWEKISGYDRPEGWVYRVGLNRARDVFRKRRYEILSEIGADTVRVEDHHLDVDLAGALGRLPTKMRVVVVARYYLGWTTAEVSTALSIPEGTVKSRLSNALQRLAEDLGEES